MKFKSLVRSLNPAVSTPRTIPKYFTVPPTDIAEYVLQTSISSIAPDAAMISWRSIDVAGVDGFRIIPSSLQHLIRRDLFEPPTISPGPTGPVLRVDTTAFKPGYGSVDLVAGLVGGSPEGVLERAESNGGSKHGGDPDPPLVMSGVVIPAHPGLSDNI